jgi:hypothetical protein
MVDGARLVCLARWVPSNGVGCLAGLKAAKMHGPMLNFIYARAQFPNSVLIHAVGLDVTVFPLIHMIPRNMNKGVSWNMALVS